MISALEKNEARKAIQVCLQLLSSVVREGLSEKERTEQRPEGGEGVSPIVIWGKRLLGTKNSTCKGPWKKYAWSDQGL